MVRDRPALLRAAQAAATWMESGIAGDPPPLQAMLAAIALLARDAAPRRGWRTFCRRQLRPRTAQQER